MSSASPELTALQIRKLSALRPRLGVVLGSGFGCNVEWLKSETTIPYSKLPGFPPVGIVGHAGELALGRVEEVPVAVLRGRTHYYEGRSMAEVTFGVRTLAALGIESLLLTNAAGAINPKFRVGDFMVLEDHINFMGVNPLRETAPAKSEKFVDLTRTYDPHFNKLLRHASARCGLRMRKGTYLAVSGPSYETPAEIRAFRIWGADAVGMSTVPEAIVARQCGLRVCAVSCITNLAAGRGKGALNHKDVLAEAARASDRASRLLRSFARLYRATE